LTKLRAALAQERLAHAIVLHGPTGWCVEHLARALVFDVLQLADDGREVSEIAHPDLRWIVPEGKGEQIKIDVIRMLAEFAVHTPQLGTRKVAVLIDADAMNENAANALLKTLEEPPAGTYIVLVTSALTELLPTIRSRCMRIDVVPGTADDAIAWVRRADPAFAAAAGFDQLAFELGHAPARLLAAVRDQESPVAVLLEAALAGKTPIVAVAEHASRFTLDEFIARAMRCLAAGMAASMNARPSEVALASQLGRTPARQLAHLWDAHVQARALVRGTSNPNPRLVVEDLLMRWRALVSPA